MIPNEPTTWERGDDFAGDAVPALAALEGLAIAGASRLAQVRLSGVVAATLRAALDLVLEEGPPRRPLGVSGDDGALEVVVPEARLENVMAAAELLETVEGSLGPGREGRDFVLRIPVATPRPMYLMLHQGTLGLALPWHSVIRIRLARPEGVELMARREGCPVLAPLVTVPGEGGERPAVLVGLGLRRALLIADRLVWRMPAEPVDAAEAAPGGALGGAVQTAEGEVFWVVDPGRLLRGVAPPALPPRRPQPRPAAPRRPAPASPPVAPPVAPAATAPAPAASPPFEPRLVELRREDVEPLRQSAGPAPVPGGRPRALVAEDSIVGRIFLHRLLEARGFAVEAVATTAEFHHALGLRAWDVMFVDVTLPDSPRGDHLRGLASTTTVALVSDQVDERAASQAGIRFALRKPFELGDLVRVIERLGLAGGGA